SPGAACGEGWGGVPGPEALPGRSRLRGQLGLEPAVHARFQQVERQGSAVQDLVMERLEVETRPELRLGAFAQLADLQLSHFVGQRLPRPGDVPGRLPLADDLAYLLG